MTIFKRLRRWWKRQLFGEWISLEESLERFADRGMSTFDVCLNMPQVIIVGVFDGTKIIVRVYRRDDVDVKYIQGLGPHLSKQAAEFLRDIK